MTSLAAQLAQLSAAQGTAGKPKFRGKPSLLWDYQKAADIDVQTIYEVACQGLEELIRKDPKFRQFKDSLFSRASLSVNPDQQAADVLQKLDDTVLAFCALLCDHFLSPATFKVLEFLIRRFKANERNVDALFLCGLPYHATNQFVRLVQTLSIGKGVWSWLTPMQESGASMPRELLVKRCINDKAVLHFICQSARYQGTKKTPCKTFLSFYAVTVCEVAAGVSSITEDLLSQLLGYLVDGLGSEASPEYRSATLMIVAELCSRAKLGLDFLKVVCASMLKHTDAQAGQVRTTLLMLSHVAATQSQLSVLPEKAVKYLLALPGLHAELSALRLKGVKLAPLILLLARSLAALLAAGGAAKYEAPLLDLVHANLLAAAAQDLAARLLQLAADALASTTTTTAAEAAPKQLLACYTRVLRALDLRYPQEVDAAVNAALAPLRAARKGKQSAVQQGAEGWSSSDDDEGDEADITGAGGRLAPRQMALLEFIKKTFVNSGSAPCGDAMQTLAMALSAPAAAVRRMALQQLDSQLGSAAAAADPHDDSDADANTAAVAEGAAEESRAYVRSAALARLQDDDLEVVAAALGMRCLVGVPPAALADALLPLVQRLSSLMFAQGKHPDVKPARAAARLALPLLASLIGRTSGSVQDSLLLAFLDFFLPSKHDAKVAVKAVEAAASYCTDHTLLGVCASALKDVRAAAEAGEPAGKKKDKGKKKKDTQSDTKVVEEADNKADKALTSLAVQRAVVQALGKAVAGTPLALAEACRLADAARQQQQPGAHASLRARHLLLLALGSALGASTGARGAHGVAGSVAHAIVRLAVAELSVVVPTVPQESVESWSSMHSECFDQQGDTTPQHLVAVTRQLPAVHVALLCSCLQLGLEALPEPTEATAEQLQAAATSFARLAALQPRAVFASHLQLLVGHLVPADACNTFLAGMYAAPTSTSSSPLGIAGPSDAVQAAALHAQAGILTAASLMPSAPGSTSKPARGRSSTSGSAASGVMADPFLVATLLPALRSPAAGVRKAACQCLATLQPLLDTSHALSSLSGSLLEHKKLIIADADASTSLARSTLCSIPGPTSTATAAAPAPAASTPVKGKAKKAGSSQPPPNQSLGLRLAMAESAVPGVVSALANALARLDASPCGANTAAAILQCVLPEPHELAAGAVSHAQSLFAPGMAMLNQLMVAWRSANPAGDGIVHVSASPLHAQLACYLVSLFTPASVKDIDAETLGLLVCAMQLMPPQQQHAGVEQQRLAAQVRLAAVRRCDASLFDALPFELYTPLLVALLRCCEGDSDDACRAAARACVDSWAMSGTMLAPILQAVSFTAPPAQQVQPGTAQPKRKKSKKDEPAAAGAAPTAAVPQLGVLAPLPALPLAVLILEMLQWKEEVSEPHQLLDACQALLTQLLPVLDSIASTHEDDAPDQDEADANTNAGAADMAVSEEQQALMAAAAAPAPGGKSSLAGYAGQLALMALQAIAQHISPFAAAAASESGLASGSSSAAALLSRYDLDLVVKCAREAPDAPVRNAALSLLASLATLRPQAVLSHVLQVLALVHQSTALQDDEYSRAVAATALAAVVPAWVAAGKGAGSLWQEVVGALHALPHHRRFSLLMALLQALPQEEGLAEGLFVMLKVSSASPQHPVPTVSPASPAPPASAKKSKKVGKQADEGATPAAAAGSAAVQPDPHLVSDWLPELASQLALQVDTPVRLACFASVMQRSLADSGAKPHAAFPRIVVAFVTAQLKMKATTSAYTAVYRRPDADPALERACQRVMEQALAQVQGMAGEVAGSSPAAVSLRAATRSASEGLYALFDALQAVMAPDAYMQALLTLCHHASDKVRTRALKLFMRRVKDVRAEVEDMVELPQRVRDAKLRQAADAAVASFTLLQPLLLPADAPGATTTAAAGPLARQLVLVLVAAVASEFGATHHEEVLAGLPTIVAAVKDAHTSVRSSALAAVAAIIKALASRVVPQLPATVSAIVAGADAAWGALAGESAMHNKDDEVEGGEDDGDDERELRGGAGRQSVHEEAALELSSALAALSALVETLGAFLSPHLPQVLRLLLQPQVLSCEVAGCSRFAAAIRARLPVVVPPRLLLQPVFDRLQPCIDAGATSLVSLLDMVAQTAASMEAKVAAQFHEQLFLFMLRALNVRQRRPASLVGTPGGLAAAEAAGVRALVAMTMKLSESKFKPLFLRLVEWASSVSAPETGCREPGYMGRMLTLFAAVNALTDRLRSVFVPYFRYVLELCLQHLGQGMEDEGAGAKQRAKKRAKKAAVAAAAMPAEGSAGAVGQAELDELVAPWLLRVRITHALHRCFLHDTVSFIDQERFAKVLGPLVAQLEAEPPAEVLALLRKEGVDAGLDDYVTLGRATAAYTLSTGERSAGPGGAAAVRALIALSVDVNSDAQWKPLNHAVLMLTRNGSPRVRALGLEVVAQLVDRLREEYLVLLPEALPFLAELLEDADGAVEARCQEVIKALEEVSGEKLDEYLKV